MKRLQYFIDAAVLYRLGRPLLVELLSRFAHLIVNPYSLHIPLDAMPDAPSSNGKDVSYDSDEEVARYSCWCPKAMAQIGHFPETLADRCIVITMQRKTKDEKIERLRHLTHEEAGMIHRMCQDFVCRWRDVYVLGAGRKRGGCRRIRF